MRRDRRLTLPSADTLQLVSPACGRRSCRTLDPEVPLKLAYRQRGGGEIAVSNVTKLLALVDEVGDQEAVNERRWTG